MIRRGFALLMILVLSRLAYGDEPLPGHSAHGDPFNEGPRQAAYLMEGTGDVSFPITTKEPLAQEFFNQGVGLLHGFWYYEAERSFRQVAALDPDCAMAYWGMAMANFNNEKRAKPFIAEAVKRKDKASAREKAYIDALAAYLDGAKKDNAERRRDLIKKYEQMVENDLDDVEAKAFLIWQLWDNNEHKVPIPSKPAMNALIGEVLAVEPSHPVHHYRIHITNPGADRVTALASAALCGPAAPMIPHMWHMPGHTYSDSQRYADGAWQQEAALRVEHAHLIGNCMLADETFLFVHNRGWLIDNLSYTGRVNDAIELCKHMVDLPRHPKFGKGAAAEGRKRLGELLTRHERWEDLVALDGTDYLDAGSGLDQQTRHLVTMGRAFFALGKRDEGNRRLASIQEMFSKPRADRKQAGDHAEAKARKEEKSEVDIARLREEAERRLDGPLVKLEKAEAELLGCQAQANGEFKLALAFLHAAGVGAEILARAQVEAGELAKALDQSRNTGKRVYKLANRVFVLHRAGKSDEARKAFDELRVLAGAADLDDRALKRLRPLAENLKWSGDWRTPKAADDVGERPALDSLGPFRWQPWIAPVWTLPELNGPTVSSKDFHGKPVVVILYLGFGCVHCVEQLEAFAPLKGEFEKAGLSVVAISSDSLDAMRKSAARGLPGKKLAFPIMADPELRAFKAFRAYDDFERMPLHGVFLIDGAGRLRWQDIGHEPFVDAAFLLAEARRLLAQSDGRVEAANPLFPNAFQANAPELPQAGLTFWLKSDSGVLVKEGTVVAWEDSSPKGNHARRDDKFSATNRNPALISGAANGHPVLRFDGSDVSLHFTRAANIRTVFMVVRKDDKASGKNNERFVLGDSKGKDLHVGTHFTDFILHPSESSGQLRRGVTRVNGKVVDPVKTNFSKTLSVISMVGAGPVSADQLCKDRQFKDRSWQGDIAEILFYDVALPDAERTQVESYLINKYGIPAS